MFEMKTIGDYHDFHLKTGVLLLADVFEKFIGVCLECYGLNPCHYFGTRRLSWVSMPKITRVRAYFRHWHVFFC